MVELDQLDLAVIRVAVYMLVDEARPVSTRNTPNVMMHGEVAGLGADEGGRWLDAVRAVLLSPFGVTRAGSASIRGARCATRCAVPSERAASWCTDEVEGPPIGFSFPVLAHVRKSRVRRQ